MSKLLESTAPPESGAVSYCLPCDDRTVANLSASTVHSASILKTLYFTFDFAFNLQKLNIFLDFILYSSEKAQAGVKEKESSSTQEIKHDEDSSSMKIYRMKGIFHIVDKDELYILQSVHDIFDIEQSTHVKGSTQDKSGGRSVIIVIGSNLDRDKIQDGFEKCV